MRFASVTCALLVVMGGGPRGTAPVSAEEEAAAWRAAWALEPFPGPVRQYALAPDGTRAATVGNDGRLVLWDTRTRTPVGRYADASEGWGGMLAFSPDGRVLASLVPRYQQAAPFASALHVLDARSGERLEGFREVVLGDARDPMPPRLLRHETGVVVLDPGTAREIVVGTGGRLARPQGLPPRRTWRMAPSGETVYLVDETSAGGADGRAFLTVEAYAVPDGTLRHRTRVGPLAVPAGEARPQDAWAVGEDAIAVAAGGVVHVYALPGGGRRATFGRGVRTIARHDGLWLTGHADGRVEWREGTTRVRQVEVGGGGVRSVRTSAHGLVVRTQDGHAAVVDGTVVHRAEESVEGRVHGRTFSFRWHDGRTVVTTHGGSSFTVAADRPEYDETDRRNKPAVLADGLLGVLEDGQLALYDLASGARRGVLAGAHKGQVTHLAWRGTRLFARGGTDGYFLEPRHAALIDPAARRVVTQVASGAAHATEQTLRALPPRAHKEHGPTVVAPDGGRSVRWEGARVVVREGLHGAVLHTFAAAHNVHGVELAFHPEGTLLAGAWVGRRPRVLDVRVRLWDLEAGATRFEKVLPRAAYPVEEVAFGPEGRRLVVHLRQVRVFALDGREVHRAPAGPADRGRPWALTPDGRRLVTATFAGPVEVFDLEAETTIHAFAMPDETYSHFVRVAMDPTGRSVTLHYSERGLVYWVDLERGSEGMTRIEVDRGRGGGDVLAFFPSGDLAVFAGEGLAVFDAETRERREGIAGITGSILRIAPDGARIAVARRARIRIFERVQ